MAVNVNGLTLYGMSACDILHVFPYYPITQELLLNFPGIVLILMVSNPAPSVVSLALKYWWEFPSLKAIT